MTEPEDISKNTSEKDGGTDKLAAEVEQFLQPITDKNPEGVDLRLDIKSDYYKLREMRNNLRNIEQKVLLEDKVFGKESWLPIITLAEKILKEESKDLEIAAWLLEGLLRENKFDGATKGFAILEGLVRNFWGKCFPSPEKEDEALPLSPIVGLSGGGRDSVLTTAFYMLTLVKTNEYSITTWDFMQSSELDSLGKKPGADGHSLTELKNSCKKMPADQFIKVDDSILQCHRMVQLFDKTLRECADNLWVYSFNRLQDTIINCQKAVRFLGAFAFKDTKDSKELIEHNDSVDAVTAKEYVISDNDDVKLALTAVADFYEKNQPHSPLSFLIRKAIRWSGMQLPELIPELLGDERSVLDYCRMIGLSVDEVMPAEQNDPPIQQYN